MTAWPKTPVPGATLTHPKFEWDGWTMVKETTGSTVTRYIAPQGQIHSFERGGQVYQVHSDAHNGSVRAITDASGAVVAHYEYGAWGEVLGSSSAFSGGFAYGYVGSLGVRTDEATGLIWMRQRWYDPVLGRFVSRDPIGRIFGAYAYGENNPVNYVDPEGLEIIAYYAAPHFAPEVFNDGQTFATFMQNVPAGVIAGLKVRGHADPKYIGMDLRNPSRSGSGFDLASGKLIFRWGEGKGRVEIPAERLLKDKGLKFIELHGCDSAGGVDDKDLTKQQAEQYGIYPQARLYRHQTHPGDPTRTIGDDNISAAMARMTGADVTGNQGRQYGSEYGPSVRIITGHEIGNPRTYRMNSSGNLETWSGSSLKSQGYIPR